MAQRLIKNVIEIFFGFAILLIFLIILNKYYSVLFPGEKIYDFNFSKKIINYLKIKNDEPKIVEYDGKIYYDGKEWKINLYDKQSL